MFAFWHCNYIVLGKTAEKSKQSRFVFIQEKGRIYDELVENLSFYLDLFLEFLLYFFHWIYFSKF